MARALHRMNMRGQWRKTSRHRRRRSSTLPTSRPTVSLPSTAEATLSVDEGCVLHTLLLPGLDDGGAFLLDRCEFDVSPQGNIVTGAPRPGGVMEVGPALRAERSALRGLLPKSVREVIRARLSRLSSAASGRSRPARRTTLGTRIRKA